jgi:hypothetical protein
MSPTELAEFILLVEGGDLNGSFKIFHDPGKGAHICLLPTRPPGKASSSGPYCRAGPCI